MRAGESSSKEMIMATEKEIENYAYRLWEEAGRPEGKDKEFWNAAKAATLETESAQPSAGDQTGGRKEPND
jgi:hypothetical protein